MLSALKQCIKQDAWSSCWDIPSRTFRNRLSYQYVGLSVLTPRIWGTVSLPNLVTYSNHLEWFQRLATRLVTGICHLPYEQRMQRLNLHSLQWRRFRTDMIIAFKIFTGRHTYKVRRGANHRRRRGFSLSMRFVKYCKKLSASVVTAPSVNILKKRLEKVWTEAFPRLHLGTNVPCFH